MSGGKGSQGQVAPAYTGLQMQTSSGIVCVPLCWGRMRGAPNVIWYGDFSAKAINAKGGKGGGPTTGYDYHASLLEALSQGPIHGLGLVWINTGHTGNLSQTHFSLISLGNTPQAPWSYLVSNFPSQADSYNGIALVGAIKLDLGESPYAPQQSFEVLGMRYNTAPGGNGDADCALIIQDFLSNFYWSVGIPASELGNLMSTPAATGAGDGAYQTYCTAMGFGMSPYLQNQDQALTILQRWCQLTNTACYWSGYSLKFVPYGDQTVSANGVTYLPNLTPVYSLTDDDLVQQKDADPIQPARIDPADAYNNVRINIKDRTNWYDSTPVELQIDTLVRKYTVRQMNSASADEIAEPAMAATMVQLMLYRAAYILNSYQFELSSRFCLLEPMDVLELTDPILGTFTCRITSMEETDTGTFKIVAEQLTIGLSSPGATTTPQSTTNTPQNQLVVPGAVNTPVIFEPAGELLAGAAPQIWTAASAGPGGVYDPNYGGCIVNASSDGGVSYGQIGTMQGASRQGVLTANLAAYGGSNPDNTNTLTVDLAESDGTLSSTTAMNAMAGVNLCFVDGELISFETATLVSGNKYNLTGLYRGMFGTTPGAHTSGALFARLDDSIGKFTLPNAYIGAPLLLKFQSFNIFGLETQDISTCTAYTYTPTGAGFGGGSGGVPTTPTGLTATGGNAQIASSWAANPSTDNVTAYELWQAPGTGASFGSASLLATVSALAFTETGLPPSTGYTQFLKARNAIGASSPTAGVNATTTAASFGASVRLIQASENLAAGAFVNIWTSSGAIRARNANATDDTKQADGFVLAAVTSGAIATVYGIGQQNTQLSGMTPGTLYYLDTTAGGVNASAPSASGNFVQPLGKADTATALTFTPGAGIGIG